MDADDKIRTEKGVVVCLRDMENGSSRLFFDDVSADKTHNPISWSHEYFYTYTPEFENGTLDALALSDEDLQLIGAAVVTRLLTLNSRVK